ncbi:Hypothetical protein PHPALM_12035 [Phytophthora palmivora]|uniref:Uncharacterized protein n=1 Tax=Phytophthora palmivora TaxID=4796 RepID=A0A2P4Y100_9STRA|nr:Hypothetical protein PHPALM_12035 [Phytophthora palmivora]
MTKCLGNDNNVKEKRKTRPTSIPRGTPMPVYCLGKSAVISESSIGLNIKQVDSITVSWPKPVTDYEAWTGEVDAHNQLRLQGCSLQTSTKFTKYHKSLLLDFIDLAQVNASISHKKVEVMAGKNVENHGEWYAILQNQLLQLTATAPVVQACIGPDYPPARAERGLVDGLCVQKRRQRS